MAGNAWWWEKETLLPFAGSLTGWLLFSPLLLLQQLRVCVWRSGHPWAWMFALVFCLCFALFSNGPRWQPAECCLSQQLNANANTLTYYSYRSTFQQPRSSTQNKNKKTDWENNIWRIEVLRAGALTIQPCQVHNNVLEKVYFHQTYTKINSHHVCYNRWRSCDIMWQFSLYASKTKTCPDISAQNQKEKKLINKRKWHTQWSWR